jgi:hypothetical protein
MKCCGSQTTYTVPNAHAVPDAQAARQRGREAAADFNALLIGVAFKPLATAMGFYGELVVGRVSRAVAREEHGGLTDRLQRTIEAAGRSTADPRR